MYQAHLDVFLTTLSSLLHATALVGSAGITATEFLPELIDTVARHPGDARRRRRALGASIDAGEHPGDLSTVTMMGATADHIVAASQSAGIDLGLPARRPGALPTSHRGRLRRRQLDPDHRRHPLTRLNGKTHCDTRYRVTCALAHASYREWGPPDASTDNHMTNRDHVHSPLALNRTLWGRNRPPTFNREKVGICSAVRVSHGDRPGAPAPYPHVEIHSHADLRAAVSASDHDDLDGGVEPSCFIVEIDFLPRRSAS